MENESKHLIFCYGTLKRGQRLHDGFLRNAIFVGEAVTAPKYRLFDNGAFPYMVEDEVEGIPIHGEVFEVDDETLADLDRLEGIAYGHYRRVSIALQDPIAGWSGLLVEGYIAANGNYYSRVLELPECKEGVWPRKEKATAA